MNTFKCFTLSAGIVALSTGWAAAAPAVVLDYLNLRLGPGYDFDIIEVIRYLSRGEKPIDDGHVIADLDGPRFQVFTLDSAKDLKGSPMHNPFGRLKLVRMRDIAERN